MSLDFHSIQSIDNLANLIQAGLPNQVPKGGMKNWDWGNNASVGIAGASVANSLGIGTLGDGNVHRNAKSGLNPSSKSGSLENFVRSLSNNNAQSNTGNSSITGFSPATNNNQANANFGNLLQSIQGDPVGSSNNVGMNNFLQNKNNNSIGPNPNFGNILQSMGNSGSGGAGNNIEALLQNIQNNSNNLGSGMFGLSLIIPFILLTCD